MVWYPDHIWQAKQQSGGTSNALAALLGALQGKGGGKKRKAGGAVQAQGQGGGKKRKAGGAVQAGAPPSKKAKVADISWKAQLNQAISQKFKESPTKDTLVYETIGEAAGPFTSTLTSVKLSESYTGEGPSKKLAENEAAKAAVKAEFPMLLAKSKAKKLAANPVATIKESQISMCWKARLIGALGKTLKKSMSKEDLSFVHTKLEGNTGYSCTLSSPHFSETYTSPKQSSHAKGEDAAAKMAFQKEFGVIFASLPKEVISGKAKPKAEITLHPRQELNQTLCLVLGRPLTKEDVVTTFEEKGEKLVPKMKAASPSGVQTFMGDTISKDASKADKKAAEAALAQKAIAKLKATFKVKLEAGMQKKTLKKQTMAEKFKAKLQELKAMEKGAKATNGTKPKPNVAKEPKAQAKKKKTA